MNDTNKEEEYKQFLAEYGNKIADLEKECNLAYYNAYISGKDEDYEKLVKLNIEINNIYLNKEIFRKLKDLKESNHISDPLLRRQLDLQYANFLTSMSDEEKVKEMISIQARIEKQFNTYRVINRDKQITDNEVENILKISKDSGQLKTVWEQSKNIGKLVSEDTIKLVKLRNEYAKDLGFDNYQQMSLEKSELDPDEVEKIFDELDLAVKDIYQEEKREIDKLLSKYYGLEVSDLRPWHFQDRFFQEVPNIFNIDLDSLYKDKDILEIVCKYYEGIGMPVDGIAKRSDLYERPGKSQHAMETSIDRREDIRIVTNIKNNNDWIGVLMHEFAHALYSQKVDQSLPWELRDSGHILTTEAVAIIFQGMTYSPDWIKKNLDLDDDGIDQIKDNIIRYSRLNDLIFSRWAQVMYRFEKSMYENPDQDLNKLWWDLVEKYQLIKKPEGRNSPDWASKIHVVSSPVYYHNYMLGHLYGAQLKDYINTNVLKTGEKHPSYFNNRKVGEYFIEEVFNLGNRYPWNVIIEKSTGEKLNIQHFVNQISE